MLEFGDSVYYIDLNNLDKAITVNNGKDKITTETEKKIIYNSENEVIQRETFERSVPQVKEVDAIKYDLVKLFIEYIIDSTEEIDDSLGADRALQNTSLPYKLVFNTLVHEGIIKEKE